MNTKLTLSAAFVSLITASAANAQSYNVRPYGAQPYYDCGAPAPSYYQHRDDPRYYAPPPQYYSPYEERYGYGVPAYNPYDAGNYYTRRYPESHSGYPALSHGYYYEEPGYPPVSPEAYPGERPDMPVNRGYYGGNRMPRHEQTWNYGYSRQDMPRENPRGEWGEAAPLEWRGPATPPPETRYMQPSAPIDAGSGDSVAATTSAPYMPATHAGNEAGNVSSGVQSKVAAPAPTSGGASLDGGDFNRAPTVRDPQQGSQANGVQTRPGMPAQQ